MPEHILYFTRAIVFTKREGAQLFFFAKGKEQAKFFFFAFHSWKSITTTQLENMNLAH